jgi:hypothetical protein
MKISNEPNQGKILIHGKGAGGLNRADVERRARELAAIDGRSGAEITDDYLKRAKAELMGLTLPETSVEDEEATGSLSRDPSEPLSISGSESATREGHDEDKAVEKLTLEGVEEAQHEQMLASRRREKHHSNDVDL